MGYFDREVKVRSVGEMNALLVKRTQPAEAKPQALTERPASRRLEWLDPKVQANGGGARESRCKLFAVRKMPDPKTKGDWLYSLWYREHPLERFKLIGWHQTAVKAEEAAQAWERRTDGT